jgi:glutathione S-transferase
MSTPMQVFAFSPAWGLPSSGPFALKLLAWLELTSIPYELAHEDDSRKGPKGKNPWVVLDGQPMGDSHFIVEHLSRLHDKNLDGWLDPLTAAQALAARRLAEEHLHQTLEYELIVHDAGFETFRGMVKDATPPVIGSLVASYLRAHFRKQLHARGLARHSPEQIEHLGRADVDALSALLGDKPWFFGDQPTTADCAIWGQLAVLTSAPLNTPIFSYARSRDNLRSFVERVRDQLFPTSISDAACETSFLPRFLAL